MSLPHEGELALPHTTASAPRPRSRTVYNHSTLQSANYLKTRRETIRGESKQFILEPNHPSCRHDHRLCIKCLGTHQLMLRRYKRSNHNAIKPVRPYPAPFIRQIAARAYYKAVNRPNENSPKDISILRLTSSGFQPLGLYMRKATAKIPLPSLLQGLVEVMVAFHVEMVKRAVRIVWEALAQAIRDVGSSKMLKSVAEVVREQDRIASTFRCGIEGVRSPRGGYMYTPAPRVDCGANTKLGKRDRRVYVEDAVAEDGEEGEEENEEESKEEEEEENEDEGKEEKETNHDDEHMSQPSKPTTEKDDESVLINNSVEAGSCQERSRQPRKRENFTTKSELWSCHHPSEAVSDASSTAPQHFLPRVSSRLRHCRSADELLETADALG